MMTRLQDPNSTQLLPDVCGGAQTAHRSANSARQQAAFAGRDQNNLTWRKYLSKPLQHFQPAQSCTNPFEAHSNSVPSQLSKLTGTQRHVESHSAIIIEANDQVNLLKPSVFATETAETPSRPNHEPNQLLINQVADLLYLKGQAKQELQYKNLLLILLLATSLTCLQNASSCSGFSLSDLRDNSGLIGNNHPIQSNVTSATPLTRHRRWFYDDLAMTTAPTASGSFSQDPSSSIEAPGQAHSSWTSILNPLGLLGGSQSRPVQQNTGGGGGDDLDKHIKRILVPRVSGTPGNVEVRQYIMNELRKNNYHIELDEFSGSTPVGKVNFANIIASSNPNACRQLVLACHYDSKMMDGFLGAIDSAVPCAMLLKMSATFSTAFRASSSGDQSDSGLGLQLIFFDGEEAYVQWSHTDSLYGSRHLAAKWAKQAAPSHCAGSGKTELDRIELFVLLDLIGASDTTFVMYNTQLKHHYEDMQRYEKAYLSKSGLSQVQARRAAAFKSRTMPLDFVEDDHVPFRRRGVPILLLLAHPFPRVWHTVADNYEAIDFPKTRRILHVMEEFVSNYPTASARNSAP